MSNENKKAENKKEEKINLESDAAKKADVVMKDTFNYLTERPDGWGQYIVQCIADTAIGGLILGTVGFLGYKGYEKITEKKDSEMGTVHSMDQAA